MQHGANRWAGVVRSLEQQCQTVEQLFSKEIVHLRLLRGSVEEYLSRHEEGHDELAASAEATGQFAVHSILGHISRSACVLLLFAEVNSRAARRILEKINRCCGEDAHVDTSFLSDLTFCNHGSVIALADCAKQEPCSVANITISLDTCCVGTKKDAMMLFEDAFAKSLREQSDLPDFRLHRLIELAGVQKRQQQDKDSNAIAKLWEEIVRTEIQVLLKGGQSARELLTLRDQLDRTPLHYAAEYGLVEAARLLLEVSLSAMRTYEGKFDMSPLALAISNAHQAVIAHFIEHRDQHGPPSCEEAFVALRTRKSEILAQILAAGVEVNAHDARGKYLLTSAANDPSDHAVTACRLILEHGAQVNISDNRCGRTALAYACIHGSRPLVELLLEYKADIHLTDAQNWSAVEHAAYRGHLNIVALLEPLVGATHSLHPKARSFLTVPMVQTDRSESSHIPRMRHQSSTSADTCVWIRLGSNDAYKPARPVQLDLHRGLDHLSLLAAECAYSISVCADRESSAEYGTTLPMMETNVNKPWLFYTKDITNMRLRWNLYRRSPGHDSKGRLVGSGIVLMGMLNAGIRDHRESLVRNTTIPLQDPATLDGIGSVTFYYFWVTPHPTPAHLTTPHFWEFGNGLGGHRGGHHETMAFRLVSILMSSKGQARTSSISRDCRLARTQHKQVNLDFKRGQTLTVPVF